MATDRSGRLGGAVRRMRVALLAVATPALVALVAGEVVAQTRRPIAPGKNHAPSRATATRTVAPPPDGGDRSSGDRVGGSGSLAPSNAGVFADAGVVEAKRLDSGTQVFRFKELDIEGRLKSPQLVYFLRRVRGEFAADELGHRTFMREMSETRKESSF